MLTKGTTFNLDESSTKSSVKSNALKPFSYSPKDIQLTPLYFLQNPHRAINTNFPYQKSPKRLSQKDSEPYLKEPQSEEKPKPPSITVKPVFNNAPVQAPEKEKEKDKKKARASVMVSTNSSGSYRPRLSGRREGQTSSESPTSVQDSATKGKNGKNKRPFGKELPALNLVSSKSGAPGKSLSPGRSSENSPLLSGNRKFPDTDYLLSIFGKGSSGEKGLLNINIIKTSNNVVLGNAIRRKSCYCSECGDMSSLEKKHLNIAIPPKRALRYKEPISVSRRQSRLVKSPSCMESSPTAKDFKLVSSLSQGFKGGVTAFSTVIGGNGGSQRGSFKGLMRRDSLKLPDPVRRSLNSNTSANKGIVETNENKESDEVITDSNPNIKGLNKDSSGHNTSTFSSRTNSPDMLTPISSKAEPRSSKNVPPFLGMNFPNSGGKNQLSTFSAAVSSNRINKGDSTVRESDRNSAKRVQKPEDTEKETVYFTSTKPQKVMLLDSRKLGEVKPRSKSPFKVEEKRIMNTYRLPSPQSISQISVKKMKNTTITEWKEGVKYKPFSTKSFTRDEGPVKKRKEGYEKANDPYNMGKVSMRSYVIRSNRSNTNMSNTGMSSMEKSRFEKSSRDVSEEKRGSSEGLMPIQVKLGKIVTEPLLSDRSYKRVEYGIGLGKSSTSIERTPKAGYERLERLEKLESLVKKKKVVKKLKRKNFEALPLGKILKAYEV